MLCALATRRTRVEWVSGGFGCVEGCLESRKEGRFIEFEQEEVDKLIKKKIKVIN